MSVPGLEPALAVEALHVAAPDGSLLVRGVTVAVGPGQPVTILGETGSGKTLVMDAAMGTLSPGLVATGQIGIDGKWSGAGDRAVRQKLWGHNLALLPQEPWLALDPTMRALPQVTEAHALVRGRAGKDARRSASSDLAALGIDSDMQRRFPHQLSGGMAQRVAIAASRGGGAPILLADEPTKGLDAGRRDEIAASLRVAVENGGSLLCITHDVAVARALGGSVAVMLDGAIVEQGPVKQILSAPSHDYTRRLLAAEPEAWPVPDVMPAGTTSATSVIEALGLTVSLGGRVLFDGLDLRLPAGEWIAVTGPSGCGKSTLGNVLLGLRRPDRGMVRRRPGLERTRFGKLYQDPISTFARRQPLRDGLAETARLHRIPWGKVQHLLDGLRLPERLLHRGPDAVSGGELQRVAIVRALLPGPAFLFADEPTSRLDLVTQRDTLTALRDAAAAQDCAVLLVTHDPVLAAKMATQLIRLG